MRNYSYLTVVVCSVIDELPSLGSLTSSVPEQETLFPEEDIRADFPLFPLRSTGLDLHILHQLHHGSTFVRYEDCSSPRTAACVVKLMKCNSQVKWSRARWSSGKMERHDSVYYTLSGGSVCGVPDMTTGGFDEGYVYLSHIREIRRGNLPKDDKTIIRRHGLPWLEPDCCLSIAYGSSVADTRYIHLIAPVPMVKFWYDALTTLHQAVRRHISYGDQRPLWLRKVYHKLCRENGRRRYPTVAESCREFASGKWTGMTSYETKEVHDTTSPWSSRKRSAGASALPARVLSMDGVVEKASFGSTRKYSRKTDPRRQGQFSHGEGLNVREWSEFERTYPADNRVDFATFADIYHRFWTCHRSDLKSLYDGNATQETTVDEPTAEDANQSQGQKPDEETPGRRRRRKTASSAVPIVAALGTVAEAGDATETVGSNEGEPSPDLVSSPPTVASECPVVQLKGTSHSSSLSLRSVVGMVVSTQRKSGASVSEARARWVAASQKKRSARKDGIKGALIAETGQPIPITANEQVDSPEGERPVTFMSLGDFQQFMKTEQNEDLTESACLEIMTVGCSNNSGLRRSLCDLFHCRSTKKTEICWQPSVFLWMAGFDS